MWPSPLGTCRSGRIVAAQDLAGYAHALAAYVYAGSRNELHSRLASLLAAERAAGPVPNDLRILALAAEDHRPALPATRRLLAVGAGAGSNWRLVRGLDDVVDEPVGLRLLGGHEEVTFGVLLDSFYRLAGVRGQDSVQHLPRAQDLLGGGLDVR